jgi:hypothetical protein
MRKLIATTVAALALAGFGLATHTAKPDVATDTRAQSRAYSFLLPYVEQDNLARLYD